MTSPRIYVYIKEHSGACRFLCTELDKAGAKRYCERHNKAFPNDAEYYTYGSMSVPKEEWTIWRGE